MNATESLQTRMHQEKKTVGRLLRDAGPAGSPRKPEQPASASDHRMAEDKPAHPPRLCTLRSCLFPRPQLPPRPWRRPGGSLARVPSPPWAWRWAAHPWAFLSYTLSFLRGQRGSGRACVSALKHPRSFPRTCVSSLSRARSSTCKCTGVRSGLPPLPAPARPSPSCWAAAGGARARSAEGPDNRRTGCQPRGKRTVLALSDAVEFGCDLRVSGVRGDGPAEATGNSVDSAGRRHHCHVFARRPAQ